MAGKVAFFTAPDGTRLAARAAGPVDAPPIVLVHGFSQGSLAWSRQLQGPMAEQFRLIAPDLRGHGMSEAGADLDALAVGRTWGDDLAAAVEAFCGAAPPILVGWSYGGRVLCEYLRLSGPARGLVFVGAVTQSGDRSLYGPGAASLPGMLDDDDAVSLPAVAAFLAGCVAEPLDAATLNLMIAVNARVAPATRRAMLRLASDNAELLSGVGTPTLVIHGARDTVVSPRSGEAIAAHTGGRLLLYADTGHAPFLERSATFDHDLATFADGLA